MTIRHGNGIFVNAFLKPTVRNTALLMILALALSAIVFLILLPAGKAWYPMGWDAGYYMSQVKSLLDGQTSMFSTGMLRSGYVLFSVLMIKITGISIRTAEIILPIVLLICLSLISTAIVKKVSGKWSVAVLAGALHLFHPSLLRFTQSLSAGLLAMVVLYALIYFMIACFQSPKKLIPVLVAALMIIGVTHIETLFFTLVFFATAGILIVISKPPGTSRRLAILYFFICPITVALLALSVAPRSASIRGLLTSYIDSSSISYTSPGSVTVQDWIKGATGYLHFLATDIFSVLGMVGVIALLYLKKRSLWSLLLLSWMVVIMGISAVSIGQDSFVYQRIVLLWPQAMLSIFGYSIVYSLLRKKSQQALVGAFVFITASTTGVLYAHDNQAWFPVDAVPELESVNEVLRTQPNELSWDVIVYQSPNLQGVNTPVYTLWSDNIGAVIQTKNSRHMCVYGFTYDEYVSYMAHTSTDPSFSIIPGSRQPCQRPPSGNVIVVKTLYAPWDGLATMERSNEIQQVYRDASVAMGRRL